MKKNYSYVSLLTNDSYIYGIILLNETMKKVKSKYPLHVLVTEKVSKASLEILNQLKINYELVDTITTSEAAFQYNFKVNKRMAAIWKDNWTKLQIFKLTQFDKIVFLDADLMILKNLDHLFEKPHMSAAIDGEYFNLWPDRIFLNGGCLVVEPNIEEYNNIISFIDTIDLNNLRKDEMLADQEILNRYFTNWSTTSELHLNKYYNIFGHYIQEDQIKDVETNGYFIHFIGRKPWTFWIKNPLETYTEYFYIKAKSIVEEKLKELNWEKIRSLLILTVYGICKNEINNVENFIKSFSEADYLCILDTGSTDGTWEYLQQAQKNYPNLIIQQQEIKPWRYDKARDKSMELIPKETDIFFMADLDEVIKEQGWSNKVKGAWDPLFSRGMYDYHRDLDENGNIIRTIKEYRIHSREWTHWVNIVHEAICKDDGEKRFYQEACNPIDIAVWHYAKHRENNYMELCEEGIKENPEDWIMRLQLAIEYEIKKKPEKAVEHFRYILTHKNNLQAFEIARCFNGVARDAYHRKDYTTAEKYFLEGRLTCDFFADNYIEAMEMYYNMQQYYKTIELGKQAFQFSTEAQWCGNYDINNFYPCYVLGMAYFNIGERLKALGWLQLAYYRNPSVELKQQIDNCTNIYNSELAEKNKKRLPI